jgi:hypothetical protein
MTRTTTGGSAGKTGKSDNGARKWSAAKLAAGFISHEELLAPMNSNAPGGDLPILGHARAVVIVAFCAKTTPANLSRTLAELGVDGISFQNCVFDGVGKAGYRIKIDDIPDGPDTKLIKVVSVIQNAARASAVDAERVG